MGGSGYKGVRLERSLAAVFVVCLFVFFSVARDFC